MRRIVSIFFTVLTVIPIIMLGTGYARAETLREKVVFVCDGGTGDGLSPEKPFGTLLKAYNALGDAGGRIVICGTLTMTGALIEPLHTGIITVTQNANDLDYRSESSLYTGGAGRRYVLNGPTVFENIRFTTKNNAGLLFIAQYNPITMGEGISCEGFDCTLVSSAVTLLGGLQGGVTPLRNAGKESRINVKSGTYLIAGMNRQMSGSFDGTANIEIDGGEVVKLYSGHINQTDKEMGKAANITINGGRFTGTLNCDYSISDSVRVIINGGDFSACTAITGTAQNSEITVSEKVEETVLPLLSGFRVINTSKGTQAQLIPEEVFTGGSYTGSNGSTLNYRIYFPDGYDKKTEKTYPVFFYFHGLGSRGVDNKLQLNPNNVFVSKVLNSGTDIIIVAPQCPKSSAWIYDANYPGGKGFNPESNPESPYLCTAIELFNKIIEEEKTDKTRLYLGGGSNGGAACWSLVSRSPHTVAGALIQAGTGSVGAAETVAKNCLTTPIWTFHGDADTTLSVEGTRQIVSAIKTLGGERIIYTEMSGYVHNIWVDSANTSGLMDWLFEQVRTDGIGKFSLTSDKNQASGNSTSTEQSVVTDCPKSEASTTDKSEITETAADTSNPAGIHPGDGEKKGSIPVPVFLCSAAAVAIVFVIVFLIKKKKKSSAKP